MRKIFSEDLPPFVTGITGGVSYFALDYIYIVRASENCNDRVVPRLVETVDNLHMKGLTPTSLMGQTLAAHVRNLVRPVVVIL
jgi:hypothetical protein